MIGDIIMTEKEVNYLSNEFKKIDNKFLEVDKRLDTLSKRQKINISDDVVMYLIYEIIIVIILIITFNKIGG